MLQSLLVPLDGSEFSERSLPLARGLTDATGAVLHLAHVHVPHLPDHFLSNTQFHYEGLDMNEYDQHHRDEEQQYLHGIVARLREGGTTADGTVLEGEIADEIARHAGEVDADMILITTHGHTGVSRMWLGSVADALIRQTHRPMVVIHPGEGSSVPDAVSAFNHVLVTLDGSDLSESILGPAADLARASGARVTLTHVVSSSAVLGARILPILPGDIRAAVEKAKAYLERQADGLREQGLDVTTQVVEHEAPAKAIAKLGVELEADVVALATHGYGGFKRALLGSVADKVLRGSPLPLLLQRPA
jgi:nucleotide-binding universal stress UspA family protein